MRRTNWLEIGLLALALVLAGCSDDSGGTDPQRDRGAPADLGKDAPPPDQGQTTDRGPGDAAAETIADIVVDVVRSDAGDAAAGDAGPADAMKPDTLPPALYGTITSTVTPVLDGRGDLYIGVYLPFPPAPASFKVGGKVVKNVDFSKPGTKLSYAIYNQAAGPHSLYVFLDDNKNATALFPFPDYGDLIMAGGKAINVPGKGGLKVDVVLSLVQAMGDAGSVSVGTVTGTIKCTATPTLDAKGPLFVSLHSQLPPGGKIAGVQINGANLSSPFTSESYFLTGVTPGKYYLRAFLDDNANINPLFGGGPDKNDIIHGKPIPVHVVAGVVTSQDVVLDSVQ